MRRRFWLVLLLAALAAVPAAGAPATDQLIEKIQFAHWHPAQLFQTLTVRPADISGVLVYPLDNALIVRGTRAAVEEMKSGLRVIDVPIEGDRLAVTLRRGTPEAVRAAALALPRAGTVQVQQKTLTFTGSAEWLRAVQGVVFAAELTDPRSAPREAPMGALDEVRGVRPIPTIEVVLSEGQPLEFAADRVHSDATKGQTRMEGNVTLTLPGGVQIRTRDARVTLFRSGPNAGSRISIEPLPATGPAR
jgi:hypothetical protein